MNNNNLFFKSKKVISFIIVLINIIIIKQNLVFAVITPSDLKDYEIICKLPGDKYNLFEDWRFWVGETIVIIIMACLIIHFKKKGKKENEG